MSHPESDAKDRSFRYRTSTNPYWEKIRKSKGLIFLDHATEMHRGRWREVFSEFLQTNCSTSEIHVEIGCNGGHWLLGHALEHPHALHFGLDWKFKQIYLAHEKARKRGIRNIAWLRAYGQRLSGIFGPGEINHVYVFFPDPWPKNAHRKNRLFTTQWLQTVAPLLHPGGTMEVKTDHAEYFRFMKAAADAAQAHWEILETTSDLYAQHPDPRQLQIPQITLFERVFIQDRLPIGRMILRVKKT